MIYQQIDRKNKDGGGVGGGGGGGGGGLFFCSCVAHSATWAAASAHGMGTSHVQQEWKVTC